MNPAGREWAHLQKLDAVISGVPSEAIEAPAAQQDGRPPTEHMNAPGSPEEYDFSGAHAWAKDQGLVTDPKVDAELRQGLHAAGIDADLASAAYMVSVDAAANPPNDQELLSKRAAAEQKLRGRWGDQYEQYLELANAEGRRLFAALPASVAKGRDYATFMAQSGLGNAASVIERLAERAMARSAKA